MAWLEKLLPQRWGAERRLQKALAAWNAGDYGVALDLWAPLAQAGLFGLRARNSVVGRLL